jgi:exopolysaccharide biosynthesis polyprenyl glycosylphosphotransferase
MNTEVKNQVIPSIELNNEIAAFPNILKNKQKSFFGSFSERKTLLVLGDALWVVLAFFGAHLLWQQTANSGFDFATQVKSHWYWFPILIGGWRVVAWLNDLYYIPSSFDKMATVIGVAVVGMINLVVYLALYALIPSQLPRLFFLYFLAIVWPAITLWRIVYATVLVQPNFQRRAIIGGTGGAARTIAQTIKEHDPGCEVIGYVADDAPGQEQVIRGVPVLGKWKNLTTLVQDYGVSDIVLTRPHEMQNHQLGAVLKCFEQGLRIVPMPKLFEEITGRIPVEHIGDGWLDFLPTDRSSRGLYVSVKRAMDITIAGIGLLIVAPLFGLLAVAIKLDSPGPVFYRPERLGQGGKPFRPWKFRTMVSNADHIGDPTFTKKNDQRITRVGRILRLSHLDELPQFINILKGDMSIVGPRPERYVPELEENIPFYRTRYAVKPGATGLALVRQGYAEGIEGTLIKLQYDLYYIKHQSLSLDVFILFKSVIHMLTMRGQ